MAQRSSVLEFDPSWVKDPVPWPWLYQQLDKSILVQLTAVHLKLQNTILEAQLTANKQALEIIAKTKAGKG